jgi:hypothetical protein
MLQMYQDALCMYLLFVESALVPRQVLRMETYRDRSRDRMMRSWKGSLGVLGVLGGGSAALHVTMPAVRVCTCCASHARQREHEKIGTHSEVLFIN